MKYISPANASALALVVELPLSTSEKLLRQSSSTLDEHTKRVAKIIISRRKAGKVIKNAKPRTAFGKHETRTAGKKITYYSKPVSRNSK